MRKLVILMFMFMFSQLTNAQSGIVSVESIDNDLPVGQWFTIKEVEFDNNAFFYDMTSTVVGELERMLSIAGQTFFTPMGSNDELDPYWIIIRESGFTTKIYLTRGKDGDEYSSIRTITY